MAALNATNMTGLLDTTAADATGVIVPLLLLIGGIVVYSLFIFSFYKFLGHKDTFSLNLGHRYKGVRGFIAKSLLIVFFILEHLILVPLFVLFWVAVIALSMLFLTEATPQLAVLVAIAFVAAVRILCYFTEELAQEIAKIVPFTLLAVFLAEMDFSKFSSTIEAAKSVTSFLGQVVFALAFIVVLELGLRIVYASLEGVKKKSRKREAED